MRNETIPSLIPPSREVVRLAREAWGLTKRDFGLRLGLTGEFTGRVEHGLQVFGDKEIAAGCAHADPDLRAFWQAYWTARQHEQRLAIIETCFAAQATAV